jgi:hypothetical protein
MKPMGDGQREILSLHSALCRQLNLHRHKVKTKKYNYEKASGKQNDWSPVFLIRAVATERPSKE